MLAWAYTLELSSVDFATLDNLELLLDPKSSWSRGEVKVETFGTLSSSKKIKNPSLESY